MQTSAIQGLLAPAIAILLCGPVALAGEPLDLSPSAYPERMIYVSPKGRDASGRGTRDAPLGSVGFAIRQAGTAGGVQIVLASGRYRKRLLVSGKYETPLVIRAEHVGKARFDRVLINGGQNVIIDGLYFDRQNSSTVENVVQVSHGARWVVLRNCTMTHGAGGHDNTDSLKLNSGANHVLIEGCRIFDGTDEEIDIVAPVTNIVFRRNVLYQEKASKVEAMVSSKRGAGRIVYDGNVFANMNPRSSNGALRFGGSKKAGGEAHDLIAIHNVFVNTRGKTCLAYWGHRRSLAAFNVFYNHEGKSVVGINANYRGDDAVVNDAFYFVNNVIVHREGRLPAPFRRFFTKSVTWSIRNNLYWNAGKPIAKGNFHDPNTEQGSRIADPRFAAPEKVTGTPTLAWRDHLRPAADGPFRDVRVALSALKLPPKLKAFWDDYTTGKGDPWYRAIGLPAWRRAPDVGQPDKTSERK